VLYKVAPSRINTPSREARVPPLLHHGGVDDLPGCSRGSCWPPPSSHTNLTHGIRWPALRKSIQTRGVRVLSGQHTARPRWPRRAREPASPVYSPGYRRDRRGWHLGSRHAPQSTGKKPLISTDLGHSILLPSVEPLSTETGMDTCHQPVLGSRGPQTSQTWREPMSRLPDLRCLTAVASRTANKNLLHAEPPL
jgi:hypothetical protein